MLLKCLSCVASVNRPGSLSSSLLVSGLSQTQRLGDRGGTAPGRAPWRHWLGRSRANLRCIGHVDRAATINSGIYATLRAVQGSRRVRNNAGRPAELGEAIGAVIT